MTKSATPLNPSGAAATGAALPLKGQITSAVIAQNAQTNQSGRQVSIPLAPGATVRINSAGNEFYLIIATAPVNIRPDGGDFVLYQQGTGQRQTSAQFTYLEIQNPNIVPCTISVWVGYDSFIDNRLIISNALTPTIGYPTQSSPAATYIAIPDLSGGTFTDLNGAQWIAIQRVAILVFNTDSATTLYLQGLGASAANGPALGVIYPLTPVRFDVSGNYSISAGGGVIPAVVSELYIAVAYNP
jgi:hypothetical protein